MFGFEAASGLLMRMIWLLALTACGGSELDGDVRFRGDVTGNVAIDGDAIYWTSTEADGIELRATGLDSAGTAVTLTVANDAAFSVGPLVVGAGALYWYAYKIDTNGVEGHILSYSLVGEGGSEVAT